MSDLDYIVGSFAAKRDETKSSELPSDKLRAKYLDGQHRLATQQAHKLFVLTSGGGSRLSVQQGWQAFAWFLEYLSPRVVAAGIAVTGPDEELSRAFKRESWKHDVNPVPSLDLSDDELSSLSLTALWDWAMRNDLIPVAGGTAWKYLALVIKAMGQEARAPYDQHTTSSSGE